MAGRESRARLLAPSFLMVGALACGSVERGEEPRAEDVAGTAGGPHPITGGLGGAPGCVAPIPSGSGGVSGGSGGVSGGSGGVSGGSGGVSGGPGGTGSGGANPPAVMRPCPDVAPPEGERCMQPGFGPFGFVSPAMCTYVAPACVALCQTEFWELQGCPDGAGGAGGMAGSPGGQAGEANEAGAASE